MNKNMNKMEIAVAIFLADGTINGRLKIGFEFLFY